MEIELFETASGWGYKVGNVYQEFDPELPGFEPMSKERAETLANELKQRLES